MPLFNPGAEQLPIDRIRKRQEEQLCHLVQYLQERVPFYRNKLKEAGVDPQSFSGLQDLHKLPFTRKSDLRDNYPYGLMAVPPSELARVHGSSGTTGKPTIVGYSKHDLDIFGEVVARSLAAAGATPEMTLQNAYGYGLFTGGLGLHAGAEKLGMNVIPVSGGMTDRQLMLLQDLQPEVICCTPSYAQTLGEELHQQGVSSDSLNLKYAVLGAEPWTETIRNAVQEGLNVKATNIYGLSEIIGPGVSQEPVEERGGGSHIWEDHFLAEVVDPDSGEPLGYEKDGVLVITTLTKEAMPMLRYWTNDICSLYYDQDAQRTHVKMSAIKGRSDDMLIVRGVNLFPTQIEAVLDQLPVFAPPLSVSGDTRANHG